jgi:hypothetical protein
MGGWERFPKAPIVEALLDIQVTFPEPVEPARLEGFHESIRDRYPVKEPRVKWTGEFQVGAGSLPGEEAMRTIRGLSEEAAGLLRRVVGWLLVTTDFRRPKTSGGPRVDDGIRLA